MSRLPTGTAVGLGTSLLLLAALAATAGLGARGWLVGAGCGVGLAVVLAGAMARHHLPRLGPADRVTMVRAVLAVGVAALAADSLGRSAPAPLVGLATLALVLDAVDGHVARRTGSISRFGARFDMEVDAFLILVLSLQVASTTGWWVLAIGAARYAYVAAGFGFPWLRGRLPPRYWCKVVAATQGVVLTVAAAAVLPPALSSAALLAATGMLAESFGRQAWQLWRTAAPAHFTPVEAGTAAAVADG